MYVRTVWQNGHARFTALRIPIEEIAPFVYRRLVYTRIAEQKWTIICSTALIRTVCLIHTYVCTYVYAVQERPGKLSIAKLNMPKLRLEECTIRMYVQWNLLNEYLG